MKWTELKTKVESQLSIDPQRATLALRAIRSVEEGLQYLAQVGHSFELAPKGALAELREQVPPTRTLSIAEAVEHVRPGMVESGGSEVFDAE